MLRDLSPLLRRRAAKAATVATVGGLALFAAAGPALAGTSGSGTTNALLGAGSLSVTNVAAATTINGTVGGTMTGVLPAATLQDTTGSGAGWNTTAAVSDLNYTGTWVPVGSATGLTTATSGAFTDTADGVTYTVTTGTITLGVGTFTYTSNDAGDPTGSGNVIVAGTTTGVGTKGLTINFGTQTITSGSQYRIHAGTQSASAMSLDTSASGAGVTTTVGNTAPTLTGNGTSVTGGGVSQTSYGSAVKFVTAAVGNGMGTYVATPGVSIASDASSWAAGYTAGVQYSIVTGP